MDVCRLVKRQLKDIGLPARLPPHSFRVSTVTDLLEQGVPLEDVQRLAGRADFYFVQAAASKAKRDALDAKLKAAGNPH